MAAWEAENLKPCPHSEAYALPLALSGGGRDDDAMRGLRAGGEPVAVSGVRTVPLRAQAVGGGCAAGNGHALEHFRQTGHALAVKVASLQEVSVGA